MCGNAYPLRNFAIHFLIYIFQLTVETMWVNTKNQ
jgi:hypothetical protein